MAKNLRSPGYSMQEIDLSQVPTVVSYNGPAFVGTAKFGPAFKPVVVDSYNNEFVPTYGGLSTKHYMPYGVKQYLKHGGNAVVVNIMGTDSTRANDVSWVLPLSATVSSYIIGATNDITTVGTDKVIPYATLRLRANATSPTGVSASFDSTTEAYTLTTATSSLTFNINDIDSVFSTDPITAPTDESAFVQELYLDVNWLRQAPTHSGVTNSPTISDPVLTTLAIQVVSTDAETGTYSNAETPWIIGHPNANAADNYYKLFKFHTLQDGNVANTTCKVSINNTKAKLDENDDTYYSFDVLVRAVNDTDKNMIIYERFAGVNTIKTDKNYIVRRIGDVQEAFNSTYEEMRASGEWVNKSKFIRVEISEDNKPSQRPSGFESMQVHQAGTGNEVINPLMKLNQAAGYSVYNKNMHFGYDTNVYNGLNTLNLKLDDTNASTPGIILYDVSGSQSAAVIASSLSTWAIPIWEAKADMTGASCTFGRVGGLDFQFTVPFQGGYNGYGSSLGGEALITALSAEYTQALNMLENKDIYDFNMLSVPGTNATNSAHAAIIEGGIDLCETRGDAIYIADLAPLDGFNDPGNPIDTEIAAYDSNYAATYFPWMKYYDAENDDMIWLPSSIFAIAQIAYNDKVAFPWYAPAGLTRGKIMDAASVKYQLTQEQRDDLYDDRINPIAIFRGEGMVVWGQKTLQKTATALDRINVRRMLIRAKKLIGNVSMKLLFEPNNPAIWNKFKNEANPILENIAAQNGLYKFKVVMDGTNNTSDSIDRNELHGAIYLQPTKAIEAIYLNFIITKTGVDFSE
jgi:hypothetical protein